MRTNFETLSSRFQLEPLFNQHVLTSLMVQLLHSHTFEPKRQTPKTFIEDYHRNAGLRRQLSQSLRMFLQVRSLKNTDRKLEVEVHDNLEALRSFVEKLYAPKGDKELEYPCDEMLKVYRYSAEKKAKDILEMLGGTFVMFDILRALCQSAYNHENHNYSQIRYLLSHSYQVLNNLIRDNKDSVKFLSFAQSFMPNTKSLFGASGQTGNEPLFVRISKFYAIFTYHLCGEPQRLAGFEIVELTLRALMTTVNRSSATTNHLLTAIRNCVIQSTASRRQLDMVPGGSEFLLSYVEETVNAIPVFYEIDFRCTLLISIITTLLPQTLLNGSDNHDDPSDPFNRWMDRFKNLCKSASFVNVFHRETGNYRGYLADEDA